MKETLEPIEEVINPADLMSEKEKFNQMTFGQKADHIWTYYKVPILGGIAVIALIIYIIIQIMTVDKENALSLLVVNGNPDVTTETCDSNFTPFLESLGLNMELTTTDMNNSLSFDVTNGANSIDPQVFSVFTTLVVAQEEDLLITDEKTFAFLAKQGYFRPLSDYLSEDEIQAYEDQLIYGIDSETQKEYACGINMKGCDDQTLTQFSLAEPCIGLFYRGPHADTAVTYVKYLLDE